ncbi:MAG TPA: metallophosphoesterase family protein [Polyangia bacterium]
MNAARMWGAAAAMVVVGGVSLAFAAVVTTSASDGTTVHVTPTVTADEIHWTLTSPTAVTFDWRGVAQSLRWRPAGGGAEATVAGHPPKPMPTSSPGPFWEATVSNLSPGLKYEYAVGAGTETAWHRFAPPPLRGTSGFTVVAQGDIGASNIWPNVARIQQMVAAAKPDLVLVLGDLAYGDLKANAVDQHFDDVMVWSQDAAYMPIWGNHEWENPTHDDLRNYKGRFAFPHAETARTAPKLGCCGEDWYWFDYGHTRFVAYPEPYAHSTWADWLAAAEPIFTAAERDPAITFIVTFGHHPAYSSGHHAGVKVLQLAMARLARRHLKYVLNLNGHSHNYERTSPQDGVVHITAGIGGGALEHAATPCLWDECSAKPAWSSRRAIHHGVVRLRFGEHSIEGVAICGPNSPGQTDIDCREGDTFDSFTVTPRVPAR